MGTRRVNGKKDFLGKKSGKNRFVNGKGVIKSSQIEAVHDSIGPSKVSSSQEMNLDGHVPDRNSVSGSADSNGSNDSGSAQESEHDSGSDDSEHDNEPDSDSEQDEKDVYFVHFGKTNMNVVLDSNVTASEDEWLQRVVLYGSLSTYPCLIKNRLLTSWKKATNNETKWNHYFHPRQEQLFRYMNQYQDIMYSLNQSQQLLYCLHFLNHVYKAKDIVMKNNMKLKNNPNLEKRDQGFTKARVLILVPVKSHCLQIVETILKITGLECENKKRFFDEYGSDSVPDQRKPSDYNEIFRGNIDDCFTIGIKCGRKQVKLYSGFYHSDIIICSPLGLSLVIGQKGDAKRDYDFLSSIEMLILDHTQLFLMQNWDHVVHIIKHINIIPKKNHDCDFSRIHVHCLDGKSNQVRQNMLFSSFITPEMNSLFHTLFTSCQGTIQNIEANIPQLFHRVPSSDVQSQHDVRFDYFTRNILPLLSPMNVQEKRTLFMIPSYFDFIRIKQYIKQSNNESHTSSFISEYTTRSKQDQQLTRWKKNESRFLFISERFYFFRRPKIKNISHLVFYQPCLFDTFYNELIDECEEGGDVHVLFSQFDRDRLERVVGSGRVETMIQGAKETFLFSNE